MARSALAWLAGQRAAELTAAERADCLRVLELAESAHVAARSAVLAGFDAACDFADDGHGSTKSWLKAHTRITGPTAAGAVGWMRRLRDHPEVAAALAAGQVSASWARTICDWTSLLPAEHHRAADQILLDAAAAGVDLLGLSALAEELARTLAGPDTDDGEDRSDGRLRLAIHYRGHGKVDGDLTPRCAEALAAVLQALGKRNGPDDLRSQDERYHDALEDACRRLIAAGCLPDRAGQPTQIQLHMTLDQLLGRASQGDAHVGPGPMARPGDDCDAVITPIVTGFLDHDQLADLAAILARATSPATPPGYIGYPDRARRTDPAGDTDRTARMAREAAGQLIAARAIALLSGPDGLAARLRAGTLTGPAASISLPLDVGAPTEVIPPHLRRAVIKRDRQCAFPGCDRPPAACQVHHLTPRSQGGITKLTNLCLLCPFHHLIAVHRWGWSLRLNPDGTTTATSPNGNRTLNSHAPPPAAVA